jgi:DNA-binding response OmpR family regulator
MCDTKDMEKILVVDDEQDLRELVKSALEFANYDVMTASNGANALEILEEDDFDLVVMDEMMPRMGGTTAVNEMRMKGDNTPVIFLSAKSSLSTKLGSFEAGADDYITKPFDIEELIARVKVVIERNSDSFNLFESLDSSPNITRVEEPDKIKIGPLEINPMTRDVLVDGEIVPFTPTQYHLLRLLAARQGQVVMKEYIFDTIWSEDTDVTDLNIVETYVSAIRKKLSAAGITDLIETKRGVGYIIR